MENRSAQWVYERRPVGTIRRVRDSARFREAPPLMLPGSCMRPCSVLSGARLPGGDFSHFSF
jgi:hypothetical protein